MKDLNVSRTVVPRPSSAFIGALCVAMILLPSGNVAAQDEESERSAAIEEIIVTARKLEENLQDAPLSITALTTVNIEEQNIEDLSNLTGSVPNLVVDGSSGTGGSDFMAQIAIRGLGQIDDQILADPAVGVFIDGVYYARLAGAVMDVLDLERIEVLRGPQGTLFGKNTMGGAISLVSALPDENFDATFQLGLGDYNRVDVGGSVGGTVVEDKLFAKFSLMNRDREGYGTRLADGVDLGNVNSTAGRGVLRWLPSDTVEVTAIADFTRKREEAMFQKTVAVDPNAGALRLYNRFAVPRFGDLVPPGYRIDESTIPPDPYTTNALGPSRNDLDNRGLSVSISWQARENLSLTSITAYRDMASFIIGDGDGTPLPYYGLNLDNEQDQFSQELRLNGQSGDGRFQWVTGAYLFHEDVSSFNPFRLYSGLYPALENLPFGIDLSGGAGFFVIGCPRPLRPPNCMNPTNRVFDLENDAYNGVTNDSWALFTQGSYQLTERLGLTAGLRLTHDEKVFTLTSINVFSGRHNLPPGTRLEDAWEEVTPMASLEYRLTPDALLYGSVAQGFKGGGWNLRTSRIKELRPFAPETVTTYEVGLKSEWLNQRLRLNAAAYFNDYNDLQLQYSVPDGFDNLNIVGNVAKVTVQGFEVELTARPTPNFDLNIGLGYIDDEFKELDPELANDRNRITQKPVITLDTQLPKAPEWSSNVGLKYTFPLQSGGELSIRGDYRYTSEYFHRFDNLSFSAAGFRDDLGLLGVNVAYVAADGNWQLVLSGTNLTDELYSTGGTDAGAPGGNGVSVAAFGPPGMWALTFRRHFGN